MFMIKLGKTGTHLTAARSRCRNHNQRSGRFDVIVLAISFIADDEGHVGRISGNKVVLVHLEP